ncbi:MAG: hypothetical protein H0U56_04395 [Methylibium sp.]|nr:hypothetical protein [Methylibium sp.]
MVPPAHPRHCDAATAQVQPRWGLWLLGFGLAFLFLNTLLTFENSGSGTGVRFGPRLSFELCMGALGLIVWTASGRRLGARAGAVLAGLYVLLVAARYADVTVPALFGRPVNLYWDGPHLWEAIRLAASSLPAWQIGAFTLGLSSGLIVLHASVRWAIGLLADSLAWHRPRRWLLAAGGGLAVSFAVHPIAPHDTRWFFALPVSPTIARQVAWLPTVLGSHRSQARLSPSPGFQGNLAHLRGADVLLIFAEAYGMTAFDDPRHSAALASGRERLLQSVLASGRQVVSARVASPTFGGSSWLAHSALLSGVDTRRPADHELLLTTERPTLVRHFARHGWRTVAWMPGLQRPWPEGGFYGFDRYAHADSIGYTGLEFGYWRIPDQASLALLQEQEFTSRPRAPRFVVFPTVTSHAPFRPVAPYRSDWDRLLHSEAYSREELNQALGERVSWLEPRPAYLQAMGYMHDWLGGFMSERAPKRLLTIVIGDHQPLATVSGHGASWDVPVHVISDDPALLRRFEAAGFEAGLQPGAESLGGMHQLTDVLLETFSEAGAIRPAESVSGFAR